MEPPSILFDIVVIAVSIVAVAILSSSESSFIAVSKIKVRSLLDGGDKRAKALKRVLDEQSRLFSAVILSGNLFTILATSMGTALAIRLVGADVGIILATIVMTFITVIFGELIPKTIAVSFSERMALFYARPVEIYIKFISPLIWIFNEIVTRIMRLFKIEVSYSAHNITEEEIKTMINIGEEEGVIEEEEKQLLHRVFEFGDTEVSEVMIPRTEMIAIEESSSVRDAMKLVGDKGFSRYPVIKENMDNIVGMLYIKDLMIAMIHSEVKDLLITNFMRSPFYIPENKMVTELLDDMQKQNFHIAIVIDEYGGTAGLITLEDMMEVIVGGLQDEFEAIEAQKDVEIVDERTFVVTGNTTVDDINDLVESGLSDEDFNTIGGYVFGLFGRLPKVGESVREDNLQFMIREMEDKKIARIKITKL